MSTIASIAGLRLFAQRASAIRWLTSHTMKFIGRHCATWVRHHLVASRRVSPKRFASGDSVRLINHRWRHFLAITCRGATMRHLEKLWRRGSRMAMGLQKKTV